MYQKIKLCANKRALVGSDFCTKALCRVKSFVRVNVTRYSTRRINQVTPENDLGETTKPNDYLVLAGVSVDV